MILKRLLAPSRYFLVSSVIAVLAVLFMHEAVAWDGQRDLLGFGVALAGVIAVLTLYLKVKGKH